MQVNGNLVDLDATAAPLPEILDRLARPTGMKVVFDGATPRPLVTISIRGRSPAQTVLAVLEGLGINYALLADDSGLRVQTLLLSGTAAPSSAKSPAFTPRANRNMPVPAAPGDASPDDEVAPIDEGPPPGSEPDMVSPAPPNPPDMSLEGGAPPPNPVPTPQPTPPPYTPSPFLPTAPGAVQPLQPFPAPTPTAPPARP